MQREGRKVSHHPECDFGVCRRLGASGRGWQRQLRGYSIAVLMSDKGYYDNYEPGMETEGAELAVGP